MLKKEYENYKKKYTPKQILNMHCDWKIKLTSQQLDEIISLKQKKEGMKRENHENNY